MLNIVKNAKNSLKKKLKFSGAAIVWVIAGIIFLLDFIIKRWLLNTVSCHSLPIIENVLHITVTINRGAAFGIFRQNTVFLIIVSIVFLALFFVYMRRENKSAPLFLVSCGLILGGAFSNLFDRIFLGFVIDYIDLRWWPVFNLADSAITTGIGLLFIGTQKPKN